MISSSPNIISLKEDVTLFLNTLKRLGREFGNTADVAEEIRRHAAQVTQMLEESRRHFDDQIQMAEESRRHAVEVAEEYSRGFADQVQMAEESRKHAAEEAEESRRHAAEEAEESRRLAAEVTQKLEECKRLAAGMLVGQRLSVGGSDFDGLTEPVADLFQTETDSYGLLSDWPSMSSDPDDLLSDWQTMSSGQKLLQTETNPFDVFIDRQPMPSFDELFETGTSRYDLFYDRQSMPSGEERLKATTREIGSLVTSSEPQLISLEDQTENVNFLSSTPISFSSSQVTADQIYDFVPVGIEVQLNQIRLELIKSSSKLEMLGIVGMAGIGKTTLAKMIFQDPFVIQHFDLLAWVRSSQSHGKTDMLLQVLKCINQQKNFDIYGSQTEASLEEELYKNLKGQRYLIVVDDLWSVQTWNEMRRPYPDDYMGSRILFTSRQSNVLEDHCQYIHQMSLLDKQTSWDLLQKKVFGQDACPPDLIDTGKDIAAKCQGLPLAIVVIAGILLKISKNAEGWKVIADSITTLVLSSTNPCQQMFALSYKYLGPHLQSCFLYMGAFPGGGFEIESRVLTRLWIAEGFVIPMDSKKLEQVADGYLKDLMDRSLVLVASKRSNGKVKTCRLHDLLLQFCIKQSQEDKFLDVIKDSKEEEDPGDITELPRKNISREKDHRLSRFSFQCNTFEDIPPKSHARAALFTVRSREVPDILLYNLDFRLLVVLVMIPLHFDSFPEEQVSKLVRLKYLAITVSYELPSVVFRLLSLQTLIVNDSRIRSDTSAALALPIEFWGSINLRHIQLQVANYLPTPNVVKQLVSLRTLSKVTLSSFVTQGNFVGVPNVTKLGVCETMEDFSEDYLWNKFFGNVRLLSHLETLKIYCLQMNNYPPRVLPILSPNVFPAKLRKLTLSRSHLPWEKMKILGKLATLEVLKLRNYAFQGTEWETQGGGFQSLSYLLIENTDLKQWSLESDDCFPRLELLALKFCHLLGEIPEQIGDIPTLSCMKLRYCSKTAEQSVNCIQEQQEEYGHNIEFHIRSKARD